MLKHEIHEDPYNAKVQNLSPQFDRPCFSCRITLPCFDYLYPISKSSVWVCSPMLLLQILVVENPVFLPVALQKLRSSMSDPIVAIDLEWRPSFSGGRFTPVALVQLATSRMAVLVRVCRMGHTLPSALKEFLVDPGVVLLGCGWAGSDEEKMQGTFSMGWRQFGGFLDIQAVAKGLGYNHVGLGKLARSVLGLDIPKSRSVTMSNWETRSLSRAQVSYAAMDVLIVGQVFRGLRLWHTCPAPCAECVQLLGAVPEGEAGLVCEDCGRNFTHVKGLMTHAESTGHMCSWGECKACGRKRRVEAVAGVGHGKAAAAAADGAGGSSPESSETVLQATAGTAAAAGVWVETS